MTSTAQTPLLELRELAVVYGQGRRRAPLRAVDGVSLALAARETIGLVGESGSGKTTLGRAILGLAPVAEGAIRFAGRDITRASYRERRALAAELQVVFQDPFGSLNPTRTVGQTLSETLRAAGGQERFRVPEQVARILEQVGLPASAAGEYPARFSGGQRQRIAIARALIARPQLVICDEPTSALDLSVQAQVLNLLRDLQEELGLSYLFISHNLAVVRHLSHRIVVLYRGRVMEAGDAATVHERPLHPYTRALIAAAPVPDPEEQRARRAVLAARPAERSPAPPDACPFVAGCPHATDLCRTRRPAVEETPEGTLVACHRWRELQEAHPAGARAALPTPSAAPAQRDLRRSTDDVLARPSR